MEVFLAEKLTASAAMIEVEKLKAYAQFKAFVASSEYTAFK